MGIYDLNDNYYLSNLNIWNNETEEKVDTLEKKLNNNVKKEIDYDEKITNLLKKIEELERKISTLENRLEDFFNDQKNISL